MEKKILSLSAAVLLIGSFLLSGYFSSVYTRKAVVIATTSDEVVCEDTTGNVWSFYGDGFEVDQQVKLVMANKGTDNIYDDEIIKVK